MGNGAIGTTGIYFAAGAGDEAGFGKGMFGNPDTQSFEGFVRQISRFD
jgi:hypothetical protein